MAHPKVQHYVPQCLLRGFGRGKKHHLFVYDKWTAAEFKTTPRNVAAETGFYDIEVPEGVISIEEGLGELETKAARVFHHIRQIKSIAGLSIDERAIVASFVAIQYLRTQQYRESVFDVDRQMKERLGLTGLEPPGAIKGYEPFRGPEDAKMFTIYTMESTARLIAPLIIQKDWLLAQTRPSDPFIVGDNPVALHNHLDFGPMGNIGFGVKGIEIYLPISDTLSLHFTCPTNSNLVEQGVRNVAQIKAVAPDHPEVLRLEPKVNAMLHALNTGDPLSYDHQNVLFHNSHQISRAERFVFSSDGNFSLVKELVERNPLMKKGPRGYVG